MKTVGALFGIMIVIVGVLLLLTGGGCTVYFGAALFAAPFGGEKLLFVLISLFVVAIGVALIGSGVQHIKQAGDDDPR